MEYRQNWSTYLLTGILPFVLVINANFIQLENNSNNTVLMFLRRNTSIQLRTLKESSFKQRTFILKTEAIIECEMNLWLSDLANTNPGLSVKFEFNWKIPFFFFTSMFQMLHRICLHEKTITYLKFKFNWEFYPICPSNLDELEDWVLTLGKTNCRYFFGDWSHLWLLLFNNLYWGGKKCNCMVTPASLVLRTHGDSHPCSHCSKAEIEWPPSLISKSKRSSLKLMISNSLLSAGFPDTQGPRIFICTLGLGLFLAKLTF